MHNHSNNRLPIDSDRLWQSIMALAQITDPARPYTRRSFSPRFLEGRAWLEQQFTEAGLQTHIDNAGNLIGRRQGQDPASGTIAIGSHSDTVPDGGRFDGIAGVLAGLEIARSLQQSGRQLRHNLEIIDFLAEEPSEYGLSCVGSRGMTGQLTPAQLDFTNAEGEKLHQAITRIGGNSQALELALRSDIAAFFELHIEQGIILEEAQIDLGIVTSIVGIARVEIVFEGRADHAGATPMHLRKDAGVAAARLVAFASEQAQLFARLGKGHFVATAGIIELTPNAANVVPGQARLVFDIRSEDHALTRHYLAVLAEKAQDYATEARVALRSWTLLSDTVPAYCDQNLQATLQQQALELGFSAMSLASGAGHDSAFMSLIAPTAMVFVPCLEGRSHAPEEWAEPSAIAAGTAAIYNAILHYDAENPAP